MILLKKSINTSINILPRLHGLALSHDTRSRDPQPLVNITLTLELL